MSCMTTTKTVRVGNYAIYEVNVKVSIEIVISWLNTSLLLPGSKCHMDNSHDGNFHIT